MNSDRIKEIQEETAYPKSTSVMLSLKQVWNECEQEQKVKTNDIHNVSYSVAQQYAEFCVRCDREKLPLIKIEYYLKQL